jgi:hypothetical protein
MSSLKVLPMEGGRYFLLPARRRPAINPGCSRHHPYSAARRDPIAPWCSARLAEEARAGRHHHAHPRSGERVNAAIAKIEKLPVVTGKVTRIRLEELGRN